MRVFLWARASGGAAVSNTDGWGFDTFRACLYAPDHRSGRSHFDNCSASSSGPYSYGPAMGRSRHGAQLAVIQPSFRHRGFDSSPTHTRRRSSAGPEQLPVEQKATGSSPEPRNTRRSKSGSGRRPELRASEASSRWRYRHTSTWPNGKDAGLRSRRLKVRPLPSAPTPLAVAQGKERRPPKAVVVRSNRAGEAARKRSGWIRSLSRKQVGVSQALGRSSRPASALAAIVKRS
jgi:hypothetical protein